MNKCVLKFSGEQWDSKNGEYKKIEDILINQWGYEPEIIEGASESQKQKIAFADGIMFRLNMKGVRLQSKKFMNLIGKLKICNHGVTTKARAYDGR